jgi:hypothetical protein
MLIEKDFMDLALKKKVYYQIALHKKTGEFELQDNHKGNGTHTLKSSGMVQNIPVRDKTLAGIRKKIWALKVEHDDFVLRTSKTKVICYLFSCGFDGARPDVAYGNKDFFTSKEKGHVEIKFTWKVLIKHYDPKNRMANKKYVDRKGQLDSKAGWHGYHEIDYTEELETFFENLEEEFKKLCLKLHSLAGDEPKALLESFSKSVKLLENNSADVE